MKLRQWVTVITLLLLALMIALGWKEIARAWALLGKVDLWILAAIIPVQALSYCATGQVLFGYLRSKGYMRSVPWLVTPRIALELNFVHHVMPSAGIAGFSYLGWALRRYDVSPGKATMAQIVQVTLTFVSYVCILIIAVVVMTFDEQVNRVIVVTSAVLILTILASVAAVIYLTGDARQLERFAEWVTHAGNRVASVSTRGRKTEVVRLDAVRHFFAEIHQDYCEIRDDRRLLIKPFLWSAVGNVLDISLLYIAFLSLGVPPFNPAILVIAFGLSSILGMASVTPGGTGVYEAAMIVFLSAAGVSAHAAIAGTLLARVVLLVLTVVFGYLFYQLRIINQGRPAI